MTLRACTREPEQTIRASATIPAWITRTKVNLTLTIITHIVRGTLTCIRVRHTDTSTIILARRICQTLVYRRHTEVTREARLTGTVHAAILGRSTQASILAYVRLTIVKDSVTSSASEAISTRAYKAIGST